MTKVAQALNLTQSAVSAAVAALEARHGTKLFNRVGRGVELAEAGRVFLVEATAVVARAEAAELALAELGGLERGTLAVSASQTIASYWLPRHLVAFHLAYPRIAIDLSVGNTAQVAAAVNEGAAELGFVEGRVDDPLLSIKPVARDRIVLVVGPEHPWAEVGRVSAKNLAETKWVMREPGSGTRAVFEAALPSAGLSPSSLTVALTLPSNEAVRAAGGCWCSGAVGVGDSRQSGSGPSASGQVRHSGTTISYTAPSRTLRQPSCGRDTRAGRTDRCARMRRWTSPPAYFAGVLPPCSVPLMLSR